MSALFPCLCTDTDTDADIDTDTDTDTDIDTDIDTDTDTRHRFAPIRQIPRYRTLVVAQKTFVGGVYVCLCTPTHKTQTQT